MIHELLPFLLGLAISGMWAMGERSLRKSIEANYNRAVKDCEYWREYVLHPRPTITKREKPKTK